MSHILVRLHGDENWAAWGEDWWDHADRIGELQFVDGWLGPPEWMRDHPKVQLDWGAFLYEVSLSDVRRLIRARPNYSDIKEEWDRPFRESEEKQNQLLDPLQEDGRYGVVWVEVY